MSLSLVCRDWPPHSSDVWGVLARVSKLLRKPRGNCGSWLQSPARSGCEHRSTRTGSPPRDIEEIVVEFDEGKEILTHKIKERFGSYDLDEAARYIFFLSNHIVKGGY